MNNVINNLEKVIQGAKRDRLKEKWVKKDFDEHLTIILVAHAGKDTRAGVLGSSILEANIPTT